MAKVSEEARKKYFERIGPYKKGVAEIQEKESRVEKIIQSGDPGAPYKRLAVANDCLTQVSYYLVMNSLSVTLLGVKNEAYLNDARKTCYKILIHLEKVFSDLVDAPYGDYEANLEAVASYPENERYQLVRKVGFAIARVVDGFGENSKWRWSFVDLHGRLATIAKNCMNLKQLSAGMDPRSEGFKERIEHFNLTRRLLQDAADQYRKKYELSTSRMDDFRQAIAFLGALKRLSLLLARPQEADALKRKIDVWKAKMEADQQNSETKSRLNRLEGGGK